MERIDSTPDNLSGKYLGTITEDFIKVAEILREGSYQMRTRNISKYPIFVISKSEVAIGQVIIAKQTRNVNWHYHVSMMEEFVQRELISSNSTDSFINAYKNPDEFCCLFVVDESGTNFVFIPYPEEDNNSL